MFFDNIILSRTFAPEFKKKAKYMLKGIFASLTVLLLVSYISRAQEPVDTIETSEGTIVVFSNLSWSYMEDLNFDGIMNDHLESLITAQEEVGLVQYWDNHKCYTSERKNNLRALKDTLWLCVTNEKYDDFVMPFDGKVTSRYGYRRGRYHNGIDIDLVTGDPVRSCWDGKVRYAQYNGGGFGNLVIVRHYNGLETFYAHLDEIIVQPNQEVKAGEILGLGGNTGRSRGSHLHFEVRFYDAPINPEEVIDFDNGVLKQQNLFLYADIFRPGRKPSDQIEARIASSGGSVTEKSAGVGQQYYRVRSGDTLSRIARANGTSVSRLCQLNGIRSTTTLQVGRTLRIN